MAITRRITVKQKDDSVKEVAFLDDITLDGITGSGLVTVTGEGEKTVTTDSTKLTVGTQGDVKVVTPLELASNSTPAVPANKLYNKDGQLYWGDKVVGVVSPGEVPVSEEAFNAHKENRDTDVKHLTDAQLAQLTATDGKALATQEWTSANFADKDDFDTVSDKVDVIASNYVSSVTGDESGVVKVAFTTATGSTGKAVTTAVTVTSATQDTTTKALSGTGLVSGEQAQDAIDAAVTSGVDDAIDEYDQTVIGAWSSGSTLGTVKSAVEANAAKIAALEGNHFEVVDELPDVSEGEFNVIYLVPDTADPTTKDEYILIEESGVKKWEQIGTTKADLSNYFTKDETTSAIETAVGAEETRATAAEDAINATAVAAQTAAYAAETKVETLETFVGELPGSATATTVVGYIDEKAGADVEALSDTADTASASDADSFVTVNLTGTVGNHGLSVTTNGIAKASELGDVTTLTTTAKSNVVAAVNEVAGKADTAVQTVTSGDTANVQVAKSGTEVTVTPIGTLADLLAYCAIAEV